MKALIEYKNLTSVRDKLAFDPSGRPGAVDVREDQARIEEKRAALHMRYRIRLGLAGNRAGFKAPRMMTNYRTAVEYVANRHNERKRRYFAGVECAAYAERDQREGSPRELLGLPTTPEYGAWVIAGAHHSYRDALELRNVKKIGPWFAKKVRIENKDWHFYSKSHHAKYGPKVTIENQVVFARMLRGKPQKITVEMAVLTGDWLYNAAEKAGLVKPVSSKYPLSIRLKSGYDAALIETRRGYKIYSRRLLGSHVDYAIVSPLGVVYHDDDKNALVRGVHDKMRAAAEKLAEKSKITWASCKKLGFCDAGITAFCDDFGLDQSAAYTPGEIESAVRSSGRGTAAYESELRTLARAFGHHVPEFAAA